jgi:HK97 family phage prohead protease
MRHKQVTATVTDTDQGEFTAIAAAYTIDRTNEQIIPGAFAETISRWKSSGKDVPLHWDHQPGAESVIGSIAPSTMRETEDGLYVEGTLDIDDSELAREAWRSVKRNRVGLSFGYLVLDARGRADGVKELRTLDLFEITLTPSPANRDTRVLSTKSADYADIGQEYYDILVEALEPETKRADEPSLAELKIDFERVTQGIDLRPPPRRVSFDIK